MPNSNEKTALVTGASRGVGAAVARLLAARGTHVALNFRSKLPRAEAVAAAIRSEGGNALLAQADITDEVQSHALLAQLHREWRHLDILVLNASGGLEKGKSADYAMRLNHSAQDRLVALALPLMPRGARIVFVTSHLAHFYGHHPVPAVYEPVAFSKKAGEDALRARLPALAERGIGLVIVSGAMIEGTITPRLMERSEPGLIARRRQEAGNLPTVAEFAGAIADAACAPALENGSVVFVGRAPVLENG